MQPLPPGDPDSSDGDSKSARRRNPFIRSD
jgi:hypothetical protein